MNMKIRKAIGGLIRRKIILLRGTFFLVMHIIYHINSILSLSVIFFCYISFIKSI
jgi:hypothetical protein